MIAALRKLRYRGHVLPRPLFESAHRARTEWSMLSREAPSRCDRSRCPPLSLRSIAAERFSTEAVQFLNRKPGNIAAGPCLEAHLQQDGGTEIPRLLRLQDFPRTGNMMWGRLTRLDLTRDGAIQRCALGLCLEADPRTSLYGSIYEGIQRQGAVYYYRLRLRTNVPAIVNAATASAIALLGIRPHDDGSPIALMARVTEALHRDHGAAKARILASAIAREDVRLRVSTTPAATDPHDRTRKHRSPVGQFRNVFFPALRVEYAGREASPHLASIYEHPDAAASLLHHKAERTPRIGPQLDIYVRHIYHEFAAAPPRPFIIRWANSFVAAIPGLV